MPLLLQSCLLDLLYDLFLDVLSMRWILLLLLFCWSGRRLLILTETVGAEGTCLGRAAS